MYHFIAYNKDRDVYDELTSFEDVRMADAHVGVYRTMLREDQLKDKAGEPYDWIEIWNDEDDDGVDPVIIGR